jgi:hypothetical protein
MSQYFILDGQYISANLQLNLSLSTDSNEQYFTYFFTKQEELLFYKLTVFFSAVLYEYKTWSLVLKEEHILRVIENRVLRATF